MKFLLQTLMIMVLAFVLELFLPWWSIAIAAGLGGLVMGGNVSRSFSAGLFGMFLLWFGSSVSLFFETQSDLADKVGYILPGHPSGPMVAVIAGIVAGLVGAFACASGDAVRALFVSKAAK